MYAQKMAVSVKVNGKVLRENEDNVALPFGSEYSLYLKNLNSVRALVKVEIDGTDATEGTQLIVPANGSIDLERFIKEGNFDKGHKFKFIERSAKIEDHRGIGAEDGLIRVEFEFERLPVISVPYVVHYPVYPAYPGYWRDALYRGNEITCTLDAVDTCATGGPALRSVSSSGMAVAQTAVGNVALNNVGITVPGGVSAQKFQAGAWFPTDGVKHVMVLKLLGQVGDKPVKKPVTVKMKKECPTCGAGNKHGSKFCRECGTGLSII